MIGRLPFREIWCVDFEFEAADGERPIPACLVAPELRSGRVSRIWKNELAALKCPPYPTDDGSLFIAHYASAELGCHLALNWPMPARVLDLFTEFRAATNGLPTVAGSSLLGALVAHGLAAMTVAEKKDMRDLVMRGGPWTETEKRAVLDYCQEDVDALARLLPAMLPRILDQSHGLGHALLRGRYMVAAARVEWTGTPIDVPTLERLRDGWDPIKGRLVADVDRAYGVFEGQSFRADRFAQYLARAGIPWPILPSGGLDLSDDSFRQMARGYPEIAPLRELRHALSQLRLNALAVGSDGRNRCLVSAFRARTGRNQPSNTRFIFGPSTWLRGLIKPPPGMGLAYVDWASQEIGIAAALSGDPALAEAYQSGDVYLAFAKRAKLAPHDATKKTHGAVRDRCKAIVLGTNYGMGEASLAARIGQPAIVARDLLRLHRETYTQFWRWRQAAVDTAMLTGRLNTAFGWPTHVSADSNPRSLMNFPMQANGAEMLRLACCLGTEAGLEICAPVHDALLLLAPLDSLEDDVAQLQACMAEASRVVLGGFEIKTDAQIIRWPDRYMDNRGTVMWDRVMGLLDAVESEAAA